MRLFTAIELPEAVRDALVTAQSQLKHRIEGKVSWTSPANLHLTLRFLGEVTDQHVMPVCEALKSIRSPQMALSVAALGTFPLRGAARVLMAEIVGQTDVLAELFDAIETACEPLGFAREKRKYQPHITLARLRQPRKLAGEIAEVKLRPTEPFEVREFVLMSSRFSSKGSEYSIVNRVPLS